MRGTKVLAWTVGALVALVLVAVVVTGVWAMGPWSGWTGGSGAAPFCPFAGWGFPGGLGEPITDEQAVEIAKSYVVSYNNPDLEVAEIMAFDNQYYVQARERSTGRYAFEFLIDRYTGNAYPEPGPNMMWNTKYGHMGGFGSWGGMMGGYGYGYGNGEEMSISPEEARQLAQAYLDASGLNLEVDEEVDAFYGYYTIHTLRDGQVVGMLSVNGQTGEVWIHTWHGKYLGMVYAADEGHDDGDTHEE